MVHRSHGHLDRPLLLLATRVADLDRALVVVLAVVVLVLVHADSFL
jgi:hypothetical protein